MNEENPLDSLSDLERSQIIDRLKERGAPRPCEICGSSEWQLHQHLASPVEVKRTAERTFMDVDGLLQPLAVLLCPNCGNTKFINLGALGLVDLFPSQSGPKRIRF